MEGTKRTKEPPRIVIKLRGGVVQEVISETPITLMVQDYDIDGATEEGRDAEGMPIWPYVFSLREEDTRPEKVKAEFDAE